jgi:hypothetical protein
MNSKITNKVEEPAAVYEVSKKEVHTIGYDILGNKIDYNEFMEDIKTAISDLKKGNLKFKSISEIRK